MGVRRGYRPQFVAALRRLGEASRSLGERGAPRPILVGGAAAEFYSGGRFLTGDLDLVAPYQAEVEAALERDGFERGHGFGRGLWHPELNVGVEVVGDALMDGHADRDRTTVVDLGDGLEIELIAAEDLIADRIAQFDADPRGDRERLVQAQQLYLVLAADLDDGYLDRRIQTEAPGRCLAWLKRSIDATNLP